MIHATFTSLLLLALVPDGANGPAPDGSDKAKLKPAVAASVKTVEVVAPQANGNVRIHRQVNGNFMIMGNGFPGNFMSSPPGTSPGQPDAPTLRWKNGETVTGELVAASPTAITWKTPFFEDPLQIDLQALARIDWPQQPVSSTDPYAIALRDGSFIYGDLVSIGADSLTIHSAHHGDTVLKRSEVLRAWRSRHGDLLFSGPTGNVGWQLRAINQDGSPAQGQGSTDSLLTGIGGELQIRQWNRCGFLDLQVPDRVDVEIHVQSSVRPDFLLSLGGDVRQSLRVETWDDQLVLAVGNEFKAIRQIGENDRDVALHICWDVKAQKCSVFTLTGDLITEWQVPGSLSSPAPGLILQNKGFDLSLDDLRVRVWDGKPPTKIASQQAHIDLADGRTIAGQIVAGPPGAVMVQSAGQSPVSFPIGDVDAVVFSLDTPQKTDHETFLSYADGTRISGRLASVADGRIAVSTSFTTAPLQSKIDGLRQLILGSQATAAVALSLDSMDKISIQGTMFHGTFVDEGDGSTHWLPIGGIKTSRPSKALPSEITRACPPDAGPLNPALFYLSSGDVLSGKLGTLDRSGAEYVSSFMESRKFSAGELNAIQFAAPTRINVQGFADPGWQFVKGDDTSIHRENGTIRMDPGTAIGYPSLMQSSEIRFKYTSSGFSSTRLRMFCAGLDGAHSMNLLLANTGNQLITGIEVVEGQFDNQSQIATTPGSAIAVRLMIESNHIDLYLNDSYVQRYPFDPEKCAGSGLIIEPASIWGNGAFPILLSDFSATSVPGRTWLPEVNSDVRKQVLTVPRFQKNDPPHHLLLAANGDVLRGEIEAATDSHFGFRSGLEELNVPRDRVMAVIWLKPPLGNAAASPPDKDAPPNPLDRRIEQRMMFSGAGLNSLVYFLQRQAPDLKFKMPDTPDRHTVRMQLGGQTLKDELDHICSVFGASYRLDKDGTVVFETVHDVAAEFPRKSYWLKADSIPATTSAQDFLAAKGIAFPDGSAVNWQPDSGLLSMSNTQENQNKLEALIASGFGGNLGSPTHWLLLTNGSRLTLAVDKFEPDFITGHNPAYGVCKVPMAQVYTISNSAPDLTTTIKMLQEWRLVPAPEPVIPGAGGEASPLLGQDAATFTLPLLGGGNFDLAASKGQVVVLDFWATWCGPCVKSLPGLVEAMSAFPADRVKLIGVNQGETREQIKRFMDARGLNFTVAMDADQGVAQKYGVDAIPHTVIVGPDGKVAWMQTGYNADGETEASDVVKKLLDPPSPAPAPAKSATQ